MPKICYVPKNFTKAHMKVIERSNSLNMKQILEYTPPPNPAKVTDSRFQSYYDLYGDESWELDALNPTKFTELIEEHLEPLKDTKAWASSQKAKDTVKAQLKDVAKDWEELPRQKKEIATLQEALEAAAKKTADLELKLDKVSKRKKKP